MLKTVNNNKGDYSETLTQDGKAVAALNHQNGQWTLTDQMGRTFPITDHTARKIHDSWKLTTGRW